MDAIVKEPPQPAQGPPINDPPPAELPLRDPGDEPEDHPPPPHGG